MKIVITHLAGPGKGRADEFFDRCVTIGSGPMNDLVLADGSVAPEHLRIFCLDERFRVAQAGTVPAEAFVNGDPLRVEAKLDDGNVLELGRRGPKLRFNLALRGESASTPPGSVSRRTKSFRVILHDAAVRSKQEAVSEKSARAPLFLRDVLEEVARSSSRRLKIAIAAVAILAAGAAGWALLEIGRWRATVDEERRRTLALVAEADARERRLRADLDAQKARLESETTRLAEAYAKLDEQSERLAETKRSLADAGEEQRRRLLAEREEGERARTALLDEVRAMEARLERGATGTFEALARRYEKAIFLVTTTVPGRGEVALATAFAVRADGVLGTNAHVAAAIDEIEESAGRPVPFYCVMNKQPERRYEVIRHAIHERYDTPFSPDVALFKVDTHGEPLPVVIPFAPDEELTAIAEGMAIVQIGFPGEEADPRSPIATFKQGYIGRVTDFEKRSGDPAKAFLIQHSALTTKGTSGSPMVDARGRLIGVNNAGEGVRTILGATVIGGREGNEFLYSATGINWGIRADLLKAMLAEF